MKFTKHLQQLKTKRGALASMMIETGAHNDTGHHLTRAYSALSECICMMEKFNEKEAEAFEQRAQ